MITIAADPQTDNSKNQQSVMKQQPCNCLQNYSGKGNYGGLYCPVFDVMSLGTNDLYYCKYYPSGCNSTDPPQDAYYAAPANHSPGDCGLTESNCFMGYMFSSAPIKAPIDIIKPLSAKVDPGKLPFNKNMIVPIN